MGRDKAEIEYLNRPQHEILSKLLENQCNRLFISRKKNSISHLPAWQVIEDQYEIEGPLNGILSAFQHDRSVAWLSVPCDMPLIDESLIVLLKQSRDQEKVATCFWDSDDKFPEPLFTIWEPNALPVLMDYHINGGLSVRKFLMMNDIKLVRSGASKKLLNINTPSELELFLSGREQKTGGQDDFSGKLSFHLEPNSILQDAPLIK